MSLIDDFKVPCVLMERHRSPDGAGGFITSWVEAAPFEAAITLDASLAARMAEREGLTSVYTVTTGMNAALEFHDVFKRLTDGQIFRATSDGTDRRSPPSATFSLSQVSAEKWSLPT